MLRALVKKKLRNMFLLISPGLWGLKVCRLLRGPRRWRRPCSLACGGGSGQVLNRCRSLTSLKDVILMDYLTFGLFSWIQLFVVTQYYERATMGLTAQNITQHVVRNFSINLSIKSIHKSRYFRAQHKDFLNRLNNQIITQSKIKLS
jgi:hypothetical protein